jgi:hypothetical protein
VSDAREAVEAVVDAALARCDRLGVAHADFYAAMRAERARGSAGGLAGLIERTFRRALDAMNG